MTTKAPAVVARAGWWALGEHFVFGWLHRPASGAVRGAAVLCPPLAPEYSWTHGTFRHLAGQLAAEGIAALRFDYTATGDSSGEPEDVAHVEVWMDDVRGLVCRLRESGASFVAAVGMRASANLLASTRNLGADALVLWDPAPSGRSYVRAATMLHRAVVAGAEMSGSSRLPADASDEPAMANPLGFPFTSSLLASLRELRLSDLAGDQPTLVLTRSGAAPARLEPGDQVTVTGAPGQVELLEVLLDQARIPVEAAASVVRWLSHQVEGRTDTRLEADPAETLRDPRSPYLTEHVQRLGGGAGTEGLFVVASEPTSASSELTCLMFNSGTETHAGPHRLYVDLARRLAREGIRSMRLDFRGIGDSPAGTSVVSHPAYAPWIMEDLGVVADTMRSSVAIVGLCSGAYHALEATALQSAVGVIAINLGAEFANLSTALGPTTPPRHVAPAVADRRWLRAAKRTRLGRALIWRLPGPAWWLLDYLHVQPDLTRGIEDAAARVPNLVVFVEQERTKAARVWPLLHRRHPPARIEVIRGDHGLWDAAARADALARCLEIVTAWKPPAAPLSARRRTTCSQRDDGGAAPTGRRADVSR